jgi:hypothetical protein
MNLQNTAPNLHSDHLKSNVEDSRTLLRALALGITFEEKSLLAELGLDTV